MFLDKRIFTKEGFFITTFENKGTTTQHIAFGAPYPGKIVPLELSRFDNELKVQKDAFLCAEAGVEIDICLNKKIGTGIFGGEGFIMQNLKGPGLAFIHAGGTIIEKQLNDQETLRVDTGCVVGLEKTVDFDIKFVGGVRNALFGGEGLFFALLRGPGTVYLQSLPFSRLADRINAVTHLRNSKGEQGGLRGFFTGDH